MDLQKIKTLLDFVGRSNVSELTVSEAGTTLVIRNPSRETTSGRDPVRPRDEGQAVPELTFPEDQRQSGLVRAALTGVARQAHSPGAIPLVAVGDLVEVGQALCLIEAMKVFTTVPVPFGGVVKRILSTDGQEVGFGDPLAGLNLLVVVFLGLVLGLRLAGALSWEREHHTLEVPLVGPVSSSAIVLAKYLAELVVLAALVAVYCLYLAAAQPLGAGVTGAGDFSAILANGLFVLPVMAMGLVVSTTTGSVRVAVVLYLALVALLAVYEVGLGLLQALPAETMSLFSLYLRALLEAVSPL